jgi:flagellar hook-basal body complex protein FliE
LKEEALYHNMWRARFGRGFGPVVRQTAKWMNDDAKTCERQNQKLIQGSQKVLRKTTATAISV